MSFWRQFTRGLRVLGNRKAADREIADEVSHYLEEATAAFIARGLTRDEAQRAARLAKADLLTEVVGEFPELQGLMGKYYAEAQGEPEAVATAAPSAPEARLCAATSSGSWWLSSSGWNITAKCAWLATANRT